jgi:hypothetical protein
MYSIRKYILILTLFSFLFCFLFEAFSQGETSQSDKISIKNLGPPVYILIFPVFILCSGIIVYLDQKGKFKKNETKEIAEHSDSDSTSIYKNIYINDTTYIESSKRHRYGGLNAGND